VDSTGKPLRTPVQRQDWSASQALPDDVRGGVHPAAVGSDGSRDGGADHGSLCDPARLDRLLLVVASAVLISALRGYAVSLAGERRRADPHWKRGLSFARIGLHWIQQSVIAPNPLRSWSAFSSKAIETEALTLALGCSSDRNRRSRSAAAQPPSRRGAPDDDGRGRGSVDAGSRSAQHAAGHGMPRGLGLV